MVEAKAGAARRSLIVEGGACEGKTLGMLMSLMNQISHPSPNPSSPQILIITPTPSAAHSLQQLLPSVKPSDRSLTIHSRDPREDARNLLRTQPNVVIGTVARFEELAGEGGAKGKGRAGLRLEGVRWVGVEEGVWEDGEARESWKRLLLQTGEGKLRTELKYIVLSSKPPSQDLFRFISSLHPPPHPSPLSIRGRLDVDFLRSPFVKHFHISTPTPINSLLPIHQSLLLQLSTLIFCSTPGSLRSLSQALDERRAEYSSLHPDDSPQNSHVFFPSRSSSRSSSSPSPGKSNTTTAPFLTTPFEGHTSDRVACVVNWDGVISMETIQRAKKLDPHGSARRVIITFTSTSEEEATFLEAIEELEVELSSAEELKDLALGI
ncbi:hypothetical protein BDY24DRAFT_277760 [Mrakia frigida]|uniref:uncharacterized protein n=1 Tax=Mrakia frigida TaxID=29902 RepID=UPI003FCC0517